MSLDPETCYRAMRARDPRFDGMFYVAVSTTGVYCRPVCPARTPRRDRCTFFTRAAEAERAGYRACFRCRPEVAPGGAAVDALPRLVRLAVARIESGYLQERSIEELAAELGVSARHLRRAMEAELGVSPTELAHSRRLAIAKQLLHDTTLPVTEVAFASGFSSVRRFNAAFFERFGRPPSALRRSLLAPSGAPRRGIPVRLDYRPPFDLDALLGFLRHRAIAGVEAVDGSRYSRTIRVGPHVGSLSIRPSASPRSLEAELSVDLAPVLPVVVSKLRAAFDLDARPDVIDVQLASDPLLARSVRARPGLRVVGAVDGFELAARAVLGQRISVAAARTLAGRLVRALGDALPPAATALGLSLLFPTASRVAAAQRGELEALGIGPAAGPILGIARAIDGGTLDLSPGADPDRALAAMAAIPGIGSWTRSYVALRALRDPDAFPAGDLVLRRVMGVATERQAEARARGWTPWRGYAAFHLWSLHSETKGEAP